MYCHNLGPLYLFFFTASSGWISSEKQRFTAIECFAALLKDKSSAVDEVQKLFGVEQMAIVSFSTFVGKVLIASNAGGACTEPSRISNSAP